MMAFEQGDQVFVASGELKGYAGVVAGYEPLFEIYLVEIPELSMDGYFGLKEAELLSLDPEEQSDKVPEFGMTSAELAAYTGDFIESVLTQILAAGDELHAQNGYQDFEGQDWGHVLRQMLGKIEGFTAYAAMLHIQVRRFLSAVEGV
jgi:hypothetical protein